MTKLAFFRQVSIYEGISLLILVFIAMPIKYIGGNPIPVRYVGMIHGILFIFFVFNLYLIFRSHKWSIQFTAIALISSIIPFGMFYLEKKLRSKMVN